MGLTESEKGPIHLNTMWAPFRLSEAHFHVLRLPDDEERSIYGVRLFRRWRLVVAWIIEISVIDQRSKIIRKKSDDRSWFWPKT